MLPNKGQLSRFQLGLSNFAAGSEWMVAQNTFTVEAAKSTHDALNTTIQVVGAATLIGGGAVAGTEIFLEGGCAAFAKAAATKIASLGAGLAVNYLITSNVHFLAQKFGVNEDYMRIGADSVQLFFLLKAAKAERQARGANCFAGNTLIQTPDGPLAIDDIVVGQRVLTQVAEGPQNGGPLLSGSNATEVDPATWRLVTLQMPDPANPGDSYDMKLLEPLSWITGNAAQVGSFIDLNLPELQISGPAEVEGIAACPAIEGGQGQVVLGTFEHVSSDVVDVNLVGETQPLQVTAGHKLWSLDRGGWVPAMELRAGERLAGAGGPVTVRSVTPESQSMPVYNLDVETDHRYLVTDLGVLVHNVGPCDLGELQSVKNALDKNPNNIGIGVLDQSTGKIYIKPFDDIPNLNGHAGLCEELGLPQSQCKGFIVGKVNGRFIAQNQSHLNGTQGTSGSLRMPDSLFGEILKQLGL